MKLTHVTEENTIAVIRSMVRRDAVVYHARPSKSDCVPGYLGGVFYALWLRGAFNLCQKRVENEVHYIAQRTSKDLKYADIVQAMKWLGKRSEAVRIG